MLYFQSAKATWFEMFNLAAQTARSVILIPGTSSGLMQEVHALISSDSLVVTVPSAPLSEIIAKLERLEVAARMPGILRQVIELIVLGR